MNHAAQARQEPRPGIRNRIQLIASASRTGRTGRFKFIQRTFAGPQSSDADAPIAVIGAPRSVGEGPGVRELRVAVKLTGGPAESRQKSAIVAGCREAQGMRQK